MGRDTQPKHRFTSKQRERMDAYIDKHPTREEKLNLAEELGLQVDQVSNYLIRRRKEIRERKEKKGLAELKDRISEQESQSAPDKGVISELSDEIMGLRQQNYNLQLANEIERATSLQLQYMLQQSMHQNNALQQAYYEISTPNNVTMGLWQENELQQANTVSPTIWTPGPDNMPEQTNDQPPGFCLSSLFS